MGGGVEVDLSDLVILDEINTIDETRSPETENASELPSDCGQACETEPLETWCLIIGTRGRICQHERTDTSSPVECEFGRSSELGVERVG